MSEETLRCVPTGIPTLVNHNGPPTPQQYILVPGTFDALKDKAGSTRRYGLLHFVAHFDPFEMVLRLNLP
jgi:hypothetical protein